MTGALTQVVIVGASLSGLRTAEALRANGFDGRLTVVGEEIFPPYDRPPLSKSAITGHQSLEGLGLPTVRADLDVAWELGVPAVGVDRAARSVHLADGRALRYDGLAVATGVQARRATDIGLTPAAGVVAIRDLGDGAALRAELAEHDRRVVVLGGGFVGCEVASSVRDAGHHVTLVERGAGPLVGALGSDISDAVASAQRVAGIDVRSRATLARTHTIDGRIAAVILDDGTSIDCDILVVAVGDRANTGWLRGSGLSADARGLACDVTLRAQTVDGGADPRVVAVGDVARWPHPLLDGALVSVPHWSNAETSAVVAATSLMQRDDPEPVVHAAIPAFWSNQVGLNLKGVGFPAAADCAATVAGSVGSGRLLVAYGRRGRLIGAAAVDMPRELDGYVPMINDRAPCPPVTRDLAPTLREV